MVAAREICIIDMGDFTVIVTIEPRADLGGGGGTGGHLPPPPPPLEKRLTTNIWKNLPTYLSHILYRAPISPVHWPKCLDKVF